MEKITILDIITALGGASFIALLFKLLNKILDEGLERNKQKRLILQKEKAFEEHLKTDKAINIMLESFQRENPLCDRILITDIVDTGALLTPLSKKMISVSIESASSPSLEIKHKFQDFPIRQSYANLILEAKSNSLGVGDDAVYVDVSKFPDPTQKAIYNSADINYEYIVYLKLVTRYDGRELVYCLHAHNIKGLDSELHLKFKAELSILANQIRALL